MNAKLIFLALGFLSLLLLIRLSLYFGSYQNYPENKLITFEASVGSLPKISPSGQRVSLDLPNSQRITVQFPLDPLLSYADKVKIQGRVGYFKADNGNKIAFMNYPEFRIIEKRSESNLMLKARENIINLFNSSLSPIQSSLMLGIVFGIKQEMPVDFYDNLQKTGLLHVIAASGMNVAMAGGFLVGLFGLFFKRQLALILSIFGILTYAFLAGFEPSIVRATIMGILVISAQLFGRQNSSFLGLFAAGTIMLFLNPSLVFDVGFQLSFMATLGLIYLRPLFSLNQKLRRLIQKSIIGEDLTTTISAQIFTLPILLVNFGSYSLISILVNGLLLWTVPILMAIGGLAAITGLIFEPAGRLISYLSIPLLIYFEKTVDFFGRINSQFELKNLPVLIICGYYLLLVSIIWFIRRKRI
ncbi:MAG: ComEC/Rec2 family competence protein [Candidatus Levybacteria bacterium]|nr:ComEC/Rec2 family competence protein [Candidatus Levybacteria bacterium]